MSGALSRLLLISKLLHMARGSTLAARDSRLRLFASGMRRPKTACQQGATQVAWLSSSSF